MQKIHSLARAGLVGAATLSLLLGSASAQTAVPVLTGPIAATAQPGSPSHNYPFFASDKNLAARGYSEHEYFLRGNAVRYDIPGPLDTGTAQDSHPYATRIVVRRPADPRKFNGTVIVEWDNVSNNFDSENVWFWDADYFTRAGYAFVGVSAQKVGVEYLNKWNGSRYGALDVSDKGAVTDDSLSYDIFTQVGAALRHPGAIDALEGLKVKHLIATGESQGAGRLVNYINAVQPLTREYDGFVLLSSGSPVRSDLNAPVFKILTEYDVATGDAALHQADTSKLRTWQIAGTSHMDRQARVSREPVELRDVLISSETGIAQPCTFPDIGTQVPTHYVLSSAFEKTVHWIETGALPPSAPQVQTTSIAPRPGKSVIARDSAGLALGGIRLSQLAVPTATNVGLNIGPGGCEKWGYSVPFDLATLDSRYPTHKAYVASVTAQTEANLKSGYILAADAQTTIREAQDSGVGR